MRMPHFRFTVRRLMVAVAIVAVVLGLGLKGLHHWQLSSGYSQTAATYQTSAYEIVIIATPDGRVLNPPSDRRREWLWEKYKLYRHAAHRPCLPVPPDPPEPKP